MESTVNIDTKDDIARVMVEIQAIRTAIQALEQGMMKLCGTVNEIEKTIE